MNLTGPLSVQDFTTLDRVKEFIRPTVGSSDLDSLIPKLITAVSAQFVRFLGLHAVTAERTETYQIKRLDKVVSLDAKPLDPLATITVKYGSHPSASQVSTYTSDDFVPNYACGWLRLLFSTPHKPGFVVVTYTGGLGTSTANLIATFPELAAAADRQVSYLLQRRGALGGNVVAPGGAGTTSFSTGEYALLKEVAAELASHRRVA